VSADTWGGKGRWAASIAGAVVVVMLALPLLRLRLPLHVPPARPASAPPAVSLADPSPTNRLLHELTAMRDLAPLFLPTERNATFEGLPRRALGKSVFEAETPKLAYTEAELRLDRELGPAATLSGKPLATSKPVDVLTPDVHAAGLVGFGRSPIVSRAMVPRGAVLQVVHAGSGREAAATQELPLSARPPTEKPWQPLQFLASINAAGLAGPLILIEGSGAEEVDQHFRAYLSDGYRIGHRLMPGIYRISIGP
jgi:hypothetical protein